MEYKDFINSFKKINENQFASDICDIVITTKPYRSNGPVQCLYYTFSDDGLTYKYNDGTLGLDMSQKLKDIYEERYGKIKKSKPIGSQLTLF